MKRFTSLMLTLLFAVTTFAQTLPATDKSFTITTASRGGLAANDAATACVGFNHTGVSSEEQKNFAFVQYDGNVYLYNVWAKKFMQKDGTLTTTLPIDNIQVTNLDGGAYFFKYDDTHVVNLGGSSQLTIDSWGGTWGSVDAGNTYILTEVDTFDPAEAIAVLDNSYTITYDFQYNGETVHTQVTKISAGANYPAFTYVLPLGVTANVPEGAPTASETVVITCELDESVLPFEVSTIDGAFGEDVKWYYLTMRSKDVTYDSSTGYAVTGNVDEKGAYNLFAFTGNPFDGYSIYNYVAGANKVFWREDATNGGRISFTDIDATDGNTWVLSANGTSGHVFRLNGHATGYMNDHNPQIAIWDYIAGATDAGSTITFTYVENPDLTILYDVTYNFTYGGEPVATQTATVPAGAEYPAISFTAPYGVTTVAEDLAFMSGTVTGNETKEIRLEITKELPFETAASANDITTWYLVRMHTSYPGYIGEIADDNTINVYDGKSSDVANENFIWGFVGDVFNGITVVNKGTGKQLTSTGSGNVTLTDEGTPFFISATSATGENATDGFCLRKNDSNQYLNANYSAGKLSHWSSADAGSTFFLTEYEETEVTVGDANWATMYLGYSVYVPEGVNAYTVSGVENGYVTKVPVEGVIPANTGVLLENAGTFTFKKAAKDVAAIAGNLLNGSVENTYVEGKAYVLANGEEGVGLYVAELNKDAEGNDGETHFLNNAGKAYMVLPAAEATAAFYGFDWNGTTGIENVVTENGAKAIFDLTGRRVEAISAPGIYIVNGKKVLVK